MSRSLYAKLHGLYGSPRSGAELLELGAPKRERLYQERLMPSVLSADALTASDVIPSLRVAVVGGGLAGLTAAWYLSQCGIAVSVFEAAGRWGGRVRTDSDLIAGKVVEAGAELIGANHPMWIELSGLFGLSLVEVTAEEEYEQAGLQVRLRFGDRDLTDDEKKQLRLDLEPVIDAIGQEAKDIDQFRPWVSPQADAFDRISVAARLDDLLAATSDWRREALEFILGNDNCARAADQSYLGLLALVSAGRMGDDTEGLRGYWEYTETHRCGGGNQQLADRLAGQISDIRLNTPVTRIEIGDDSVGITWGEDAGGDEAFDYVVLATPPTAWPTIECPRFGWDPSEYTMSHGPAVKYLSVFETQFWLDQKLAPSAMWDRLGSVWESTDKQPDGLPQFGLSVYSGGQYVLDETEYPQRLAELYPGYAPTAVRFVDWPNTSYIWTGYSVPSPGQACSIGRLLSVPYADRMYFAGEQSYVPFFGYMEGALQSGARAARDIIGAVCPDALG